MEEVKVMDKSISKVVLDKRTPTLRFAGFGENFDLYLYGDLYSFYSTNSLSRDKLNYTEGEVLNIHYGDIHMKFPTIFEIEKNEVPFINKDIELDKIKDENYCRVGDLVTADASEDYNDIGKTIELISLNGKKVLAGLHTILSRPKGKNTVLGFMGYLMQSWYIRKQVMTISQGAKVLGISSTKLKDVRLYLPSLPEQQKIASFLTSVDDKINQLTKKLTLLEQYKKGVMQKIFSQEIRFKDDDGKDFPEWVNRKLCEVLKEHGLKSTGKEEVCSVSVHKGVINQIEHLGRSFAAKSTSHYNRVLPGDIIYTKSPTGDFPLGIIKQCKLNREVLVSPLYGVFTPESIHLGYILDVYFESNINTKNYLASIIQKGAKNTINITNKTFLSKYLKLPISYKEQQKIASFLTSIDKKIEQVNIQLDKTKAFKKGLLQQMFV